MLSNYDGDLDFGHVKFVNYDAPPGSLCGGRLTLNIDGEDVTFGTANKSQFVGFWESGGHIKATRDGELYVTKGEWIVDYNLIPTKYKKYAKEIDAVFVGNVPPGCCGGCL